jgi:hypothetical protein
MLKKVLQHLLYFTQNQQEVPAIFSVVNSEHPACYHSAIEHFIMYAQGIIKMVWYGYVCFKQCTVTEFLVAEKSIMNIHKQLKNSTVKRWPSRIADSRKATQSSVMHITLASQQRHSLRYYFNLLKN